MPAPKKNTSDPRGDLLDDYTPGGIFAGQNALSSTTHGVKIVLTHHQSSMLSPWEDVETDDGIFTDFDRAAGLSVESLKHIPSNCRRGECTTDIHRLLEGQSDSMDTKYFGTTTPPTPDNFYTTY